MDYRMKRNIGIITILVGVGIFFISIIFSTDYDDLSCISYSISIPIIFSIDPSFIGKNFFCKGGIAIPLKYMLSLSIVLILVGTGVVLLSKKQ